jgi:hypothetical protein
MKKHYIHIWFDAANRELGARVFIETEEDAKKVKNALGSQVLIIEIDHANFQSPKILN